MGQSPKLTESMTARGKCEHVFAKKNFTRKTVCIKVGEAAYPKVHSVQSVA